MSTGKKIAIAAAVIVVTLLVWKFTAPSSRLPITNTVPEPITESGDGSASKFPFKPVRKAAVAKLRVFAPRLFPGVQVV